MVSRYSGINRLNKIQVIELFHSVYLSMFWIEIYIFRFMEILNDKILVNEYIVDHKTHVSNVKILY